MKLLIDAQISPAIAAWINREFVPIRASSARSVGLQSARDMEIFRYAKENGYVIMSKDGDFLRKIEEFGTPPSLIWITCGNTSNEKLREILGKTLQDVLDMLEDGESVVEISDAAI